MMNKLLFFSCLLLLIAATSEATDGQAIDAAVQTIVALFTKKETNSIDTWARVELENKFLKPDFRITPKAQKRLQELNLIDQEGNPTFAARVGYDKYVQRLKS